jgi:hypothetical protein
MASILIIESKDVLRHCSENCSNGQGMSFKRQRLRSRHSS